MIKRTKINLIHHAASLAVLGSLLVTGPVAFANTTGDALPASTSPSDTTHDGAADIGTAISSPGIQSLPDQDVPASQPPKRSFSETAAKVFDAMSKHPTEREGKIPEWRVQQDAAVEQARQGHYDVALPALDNLRKQYPQNLGIASDYAAILAWAGRDQDAVDAYKALPAPPQGTNRPDYLIDAVGHSYRNLHQPDQALEVYRLGLQTYPDNQSFAAGEILSLLDANNIKEAKDKAQAASDKYPNPSDDLVTAIKLTFRADAVGMARAGQYKESLAAFAALHKKYPDDAGITGDYTAVLSWAGHDREAVEMFRTLPGDQPDYVLDAAAHSYRNLRQPKQALDLYQAALAKDPDNVVYAVGVIYSLSDLGRDKEALQVAEQQMAKHPEKPKTLVQAYVYVERHRAIALARAGHYNEALKLLRELRAKYPSDSTEEWDYIAVSSWAGHDGEATKEYVKHKRQSMPDYVLEAVGASYRRMHQSDNALAVYKRGLKQSPRNEIFAAGAIRCLDDLNRSAEGEKLAKDYQARYGDRLDVLNAGGEAANLNEDSIEALNFYERGNAISPKNRESLRGLIHTEDAVGAPHLALGLANKHPGLMKGDEYRALVGSADGALVRWGPLEPASEADRYGETDKAIATLDAHIGEWTAKNDPAVYPNILRARFDRLVALRDRGRMQDVVTDYNQLVQEGVEVPTYALEPVGEAYLYLREPEIARDIFKKVLESNPNDFEARRLLAYAYLECDEVTEADNAIDKLQADQPIWIYLKGEPERQPNPERQLADLDAGEIRAYSDRLGEADEHLTPIVEAAPFDARNRDAAGNLYLARGLPRAAIEQYQIAQNIQTNQGGHDLAAEVGIASANLEMQNFEQATQQINSLSARYPENLAVQRAQRDLDIHNMAELDAHAGYNFLPLGNSANGDLPHGQGYDVGAELYSSPIDYNWRLFAGEDYAHEHEPNAEGIIDYERSNAGIEYRNGDVTASIAPTLNIYDGNNRVGVDGKGKYTFNDMWSAGIAAELFSANTPLRALNAHVTADEYDLNAMWRQNEERSLSLDAYAMPFSDGNFRTVEDAEFLQRLYTDANLKLDMEANAATTQNNKDENRLYYNPSLDFSGLAGLRATQALYHRYETLWEQSLLAMPGFYSQQHYGTSPSWLVRYEQRVHYSDTLNVGAGVNYLHQDYDGAAEDAISLTVDVVERF